MLKTCFSKNSFAKNFFFVNFREEGQINMGRTEDEDAEFAIGFFRFFFCKIG